MCLLKSLRFFGCKCIAKFDLAQIFWTKIGFFVNKLGRKVRFMVFEQSQTSVGDRKMTRSCLAEAFEYGYYYTGYLMTKPLAVLVKKVMKSVAYLRKP
jgi:hypothetical protein